MKRTIDQRLDHTLEQIRSGTFKLIPHPGSIEIKDPIEFQKRIDKFRRLNDLPPEKIEFGEKVAVKVELNKTTLTRVSKLAKRRKVPVNELIALIVEAAC